MEKTKLGISVALTAALLYFLGLISPIALVVAAGYVLIAEKDQWLRKSAVQALAIMLFYQIVVAVIGVGSYLFTFLNNVITNFAHSFHIGYPLHIDNILLSLAWLAQAVLLLILGFMALANKGFDLPMISDFADKHLGLPRKPKAAPQTPQTAYAQPNQAYPYGSAQPNYGQQGYPAQQQTPAYTQQPYTTSYTTAQPQQPVNAGAQPAQQPLYTGGQNPQNPQPPAAN